MSETKSWLHMTPEEKEAFRDETQRKHRQYLYDLYTEVVDAVLETYDVSEEVAIQAVAEHCDEVEQQAIEETRQDLNDRAPEVAIEIAATQEWEEKSEDDEEDA